MPELHHSPESEQTTIPTSQAWRYVCYLTGVSYFPLLWFSLRRMMSSGTSWPQSPWLWTTAWLPTLMAKTSHLSLTITAALSFKSMWVWKQHIQYITYFYSISIAFVHLEAENPLRCSFCPLCHFVCQRIQEIFLQMFWTAGRVGLAAQLYTDFKLLIYEAGLLLQCLQLQKGFLNFNFYCFWHAEFPFLPMNFFLMQASLISQIIYHLLRNKLSTKSRETCVFLIILFVVATLLANKSFTIGEAVYLF